MSPQTRAGMVLGLCAIVAIVTLSLTQYLTGQRIEQARQQLLLEGLSAVLPRGHFDNDPLDSVRKVTAPELGSDHALPIYTVYRDKRPLAAVLSVIAPDGYNGNIHLLVGVTVDGEIIGVRVSEHHETPGLGDDIEYQRSEWITQFDGQSLQSVTPAGWNVKKQGGRFDALTGATVTPRAIINAIHRALDWYQGHRKEVFAS